MTIIKNSITEAAAAAGATPTLTAEEVLGQLRAIRERIPEFVQLPRTRETQALRRKARLNVQFAREAFSAIGASEAVEGVVGVSPDELHLAEDEAGRWTIVESELHTMLQGVAAGNVLRRRRIAEVALQAYAVSNQLVKREEYAFLLPHVERMKRLPKYVSRRRAKAAAEAEPPAPPQTPST